MLGTIYVYLGFAPVGLSDESRNCAMGLGGSRNDHKVFQILNKQSKLARDTILNLTSLDLNKNQK